MQQHSAFPPDAARALADCTKPYNNQVCTRCVIQCGITTFLCIYKDSQMCVAMLFCRNPNAGVQQWQSLLQVNVTSRHCQLQLLKKKQVKIARYEASDA
jgi:hypothetical protein